MRVLGLDVGDRRIGVAVSDPLMMCAQGLTVLQRRKEQDDIEKIKGIVKDQEVSRIICGFPRNMNGTSGPQAEKVGQFSEALQKAVDIPVTLWDERLSTVAAERVLNEAGLGWRKQRKVVDKTAACVILQSYLDSCRLRAEDEGAESQSLCLNPSQRIDNPDYVGGNGMSEKINGEPLENGEEEMTVVVLEDEDGKSEEYGVLGSFEFEDRRYAVLAPMDGEADTEDLDDEAEEIREAFIFIVTEDDEGNDVFQDVEDDDEFERVAEFWAELDIDDEYEGPDTEAP